MLKSGLCDYVDTNILLSGTRKVAALTSGRGNHGKRVTIKNCALFNDCITEINNPKIYNAKDIDIVMSIYNLIEYSDNYLKVSWRLW